MSIPISQVRAEATVRLVPSGHSKPPVLAPLAGSREDEELIMQLEGLTSGRLVAEVEGLKNLNPRELTYKVWGYTHINAAFAYTREEGNRFNDNTRGAWYCAFDDLTALEEVIFHRTRELMRINVFEDDIEYQSLLASFVGSFHDVRNIKPKPDYLGLDPALAYPKGQKLARELRDIGSIGIVYPSARRTGHDCLVAFNPHHVQHVRFGGRWQLRWDGSSTPKVMGA